jgi:hypothetical protein
MEDETARIDRKALYEEVWSEPVTIVAQRYGLSDVGLAKICRKLSIPLPSRGYWAKVKAGRVMGKVPLPKLATSREPIVPLRKAKPDLIAAKQEVTEKVKATRKPGKAAVLVPETLVNPHPLIRAAEKRLKRRDGWNDPAGLRSAPAEVLHIECTRPALERALLLADTLLKELQKLDVSVEIDTTAGQTFLLANGTRVSFFIHEQVKRLSHEPTRAEKRARDRYWSRIQFGLDAPYPDIPQYDYLPTGILKIEVGRFPSRSWSDTEKTQLEARLGQVVLGIMTLAAEIKAKEDEEARRKEARQRAKERYIFLKDRLEKESAQFKQLEADAKNWERASQLRNFIAAMEEQAGRDGRATEAFLEWLEWARAKADWLDPLILVCDPILDAPEPKEPGYWW